MIPFHPIYFLLLFNQFNVFEALINYLIFLFIMSIVIILLLWYWYVYYKIMLGQHKNSVSDGQAPPFYNPMVFSDKFKAV